jgi:glycosyltransferase involved in cell wall biosynthesis
MIVITQKGGQPLLGRIRGVEVLVYESKSVASCILEAINSTAHKPERDGFLFVAPGGVANTARIWPMVGRRDFDIAAHVDRVGSSPERPGNFDGIGRVSLDTVFVKPTVGGRRAVARWVERNHVSPKGEAVNLAIALKELRELSFLHLPRTWIWREEMRPFDLNAEPIIEFSGKDSKPKATKPVEVKVKKREPKEAPRLEPEVLYSSHLRDYSGYAKASRNILFRISNSIRTRVDNAEISKEPIIVDPDTNRRIDAYTGTLISKSAPLFRFYTPKHETRGSYRICSTMMETETLSPEFGQLLNQNYQEAIVPTEWNREVFRNGGVKIPVSVIPLGVDPVVYRPGPRTRRLKALLLTTPSAGRLESPVGYTFFCVFQPTFRKGIDHLVAAFDRAFSRRRDDASLVLVTSVHAKLEQYGCSPFSRLRGARARSARSRIYHLTGSWNEWELANLYRSFDCYAASSIGEGYDLPMVEAAACGLPVIATRCSSHTELLGKTSAWTYAPDDYAVVPGSELVSVFYEGQRFASFGQKAVECLSDLLRSAVDSMKRSTRDRVVEIGHTWSRSAELVSERIVRANG